MGGLGGRGKLFGVSKSFPLPPRKPQNKIMIKKQKNILQNIFAAGLAAVAPDGAVMRALRLEKSVEGDVLWVQDTPYALKGKKILLLGAGKGVAPMAKAVEDMLGEYIEGGLVIAKYDHGLELKCIQLKEAAHPVPDDAGVQATAALLAMAQKATAEHVVLCVFTGGASALTPAPAHGLNLSHVQETTAALLACGATIEEINAVRKHMSIFSGGQLARAAQPAQVVGLMISDVIGDALDVIASGPTVPDASTFSTCYTVIQKYGLEQKIPQPVLSHLQAGVRGDLPDTPKAEDTFFVQVQNALVATNDDALEAMTSYAAEQGFEVCVLEEALQGEARQMAESLVGMVCAMQKELKAGDAPICLLAGGETTVQIKGKGKGGRNQEMALAAGIALAEKEGIYALFAGTDGTDGPTDAAGGFAHGQSLQKLGAQAQAYLDNNDSYTALTQSGDIFITGPTRTNVMDVTVILIYAV